MKEKRQSSPEPFQKDHLRALEAFLDIFPEGADDDVLDLSSTGLGLEEPGDEDVFLFELTTPMQIICSIMVACGKKYNKLLAPLREKIGQFGCCEDCAERDGLLDEEDQALLKKARAYSHVEEALETLYSGLMQVAIAEIEGNLPEQVRNVPAKISVKKDFQVFATPLSQEEISRKHPHFFIISGEEDAAVHFEPPGSSRHERPDPDFEKMAADSGVELNPNITTGKS